MYGMNNHHHQAMPSSSTTYSSSVGGAVTAAAASTSYVVSSPYGVPAHQRTVIMDEGNTTSDEAGRPQQQQQQLQYSQKQHLLLNNNNSNNSDTMSLRSGSVYLLNGGMMATSASELDAGVTPGSGAIIYGTPVNHQFAAGGAVDALSSSVILIPAGSVMGQQQPADEKTHINMQIYVHELQIQKCLTVCLDTLVWDVKRRLFEALPQHPALKEFFNFGLFLPPCDGRAGKFLLEDRTVRDYPFHDCVPYIELKYKKRIYKGLHFDEKAMRNYHSEKNLKKFMEHVKNGNAVKIEKMCQHGLDPNFHDAEGDTPLTLAAGLPDARRVLMELVGGGAHIDFRNREGQTGMHKAAFLSMGENVKALLELGASPNYRDVIGLTPLYYNLLTPESDPRVAEMLLADAADLAVEDMHANQPLHQACKNGLVRHVEHLLYYGADINARNVNGNTPLHVCAVNNRVECARVLLYRGADPTLLNRYGQTAARVAQVVNNMGVADAIHTHNPQNCAPFCGPPKFNHSRRRMVTGSSVGGGSQMSRRRSLSHSSMTSLQSMGSAAGLPYQQRAHQPMIVPASPSPTCSTATITMMMASGDGSNHGGNNVGVYAQSSLSVSDYGTLKKFPPDAVVQLPPGNAAAVAATEPNTPRILVIPRGPKGFGFILRGANHTDPNELNFEPSALVPALQYFEGVETTGMAIRAGLRPGDYLLEINGIDVRRASHEQVVDLIGQATETISLKVITIDAAAMFGGVEHTPAPSNYHYATATSGAAATVSASSHYAPPTLLRRNQSVPRGGGGGGGGALPPMPPQRDPVTSMTFGRGGGATTSGASRLSSVYGTVSGSSTEQQQHYYAGNNNNNNNKVNGQQQLTQQRCASVKSRASPARRISAAELEHLMIRQNNNNGQPSQQQPQQQQQNPSGPRTFTSVAEMKRRKEGTVGGPPAPPMSASPMLLQRANSSGGYYGSGQPPRSPSSASEFSAFFASGADVPPADYYYDGQEPSSGGGGTLLKSFNSSPDLANGGGAVGNSVVLRPKTPPPPPPPVPSSSGAAYAADARQRLSTLSTNNNSVEYGSCTTVAGKPANGSNASTPIATASAPPPPPPPPPNLLNMKLTTASAPTTRHTVGVAAKTVEKSPTTADCRGISALALQSVKLRPVSSGCGKPDAEATALPTGKLKPAVAIPTSPSASAQHKPDFDADLRSALARRRSRVTRTFDDDASVSVSSSSTGDGTAAGTSERGVSAAGVTNSAVSADSSSSTSSVDGHSSQPSNGIVVGRYGGGLSLRESVRESVSSSGGVDGGSSGGDKFRAGHHHHQHSPPGGGVINGGGSAVTVVSAIIGAGGMLGGKKDSGYTSSRTSLEPSECGDDQQQQQQQLLHHHHSQSQQQQHQQQQSGQYVVISSTSSSSVTSAYSPSGASSASSAASPPQRAHAFVRDDEDEPLIPLMKSVPTVLEAHHSVTMTCGNGDGSDGSSTMVEERLLYAGGQPPTSRVTLYSQQLEDAYAPVIGQNSTMVVAKSTTSVTVNALTAIASKSMPATGGQVSQQLSENPVRVPAVEYNNEDDDECKDEAIMAPVAEPSSDGASSGSAETDVVLPPRDTAFRTKRLALWNAEDVANWLVEELRLEQYAKRFLQQGIDGRALNAFDRTRFTQLGVTRVAHRQSMEQSLRDYRHDGK